MLPFLIEDIAIIAVFFVYLYQCFVVHFVLLEDLEDLAFRGDICV